MTDALCFIALVIAAFAVIIAGAVFIAVRCLADDIREQIEGFEKRLDNFAEARMFERKEQRYHHDEK